MGGVTVKVTGNMHHEILWDLKRQHVVEFLFILLQLVFNAPELSWKSQDLHVAHFQILFWGITDAHSRKHRRSWI